MCIYWWFEWERERGGETESNTKMYEFLLENCYTFHVDSLWNVSKRSRISPSPPLFVSPDAKSNITQFLSCSYVLFDSVFDDCMWNDFPHSQINFLSFSYYTWKSWVHTQQFWQEGELIQILLEEVKWQRMKWNLSVLLTLSHSAFEIHIPYVKSIRIQYYVVILFGMRRKVRISNFPIGDRSRKCNFFLCFRWNCNISQPV